MKKYIIIILLLSATCVKAQVVSNFLDMRSTQNGYMNVIDFVEGDVYNYMLVEGRCENFEINEGEETIFQGFPNEYGNFRHIKTILKLDKYNNFIDNLIFLNNIMPDVNIPGFFSFGLEYTDSTLYVVESVNNVDSIYINEDLFTVVDSQSTFILKYNESFELQDSVFFCNPQIGIDIKHFEVLGEKIYLAGDYIGYEIDKCFEMYDTEICLSDMADDILEDLDYYDLPSFQIELNMETEEVLDYHVFCGFHGGGLPSGRKGLMDMKVDVNGNTFISTDAGAGGFRGYGLTYPSTKSEDVVSICIDETGEVKYDILYSGSSTEAQFLFCLGDGFSIEYGVAFSDPLTIDGVDYDAKGRSFILRKDDEGEIVWFKTIGAKAGMIGLEFDSEGNIWANGSIGSDTFRYDGILYTTDLALRPPTIFHIDVETGDLINYYVFNNLTLDGEINTTQLQNNVQFIKPIEDGKIKLSVLFDDVLPLYGDTIYSDQDEELSNTVNITFDLDPSQIVDTEEIGVDLTTMLMLYPNPIARGETINCLNRSIEKIMINDMKGKKVWEGACGDKIPILAPDIYIAQYRLGAQNYTTKLIIK